MGLASTKRRSSVGAEGASHRQEYRNQHPLVGRVLCGQSFHRVREARERRLPLQGSPHEAVVLHAGTQLVQFLEAGEQQRVALEELVSPGGIHEAEDVGARREIRGQSPLGFGRDLRSASVDDDLHVVEKVREGPLELGVRPAPGQFVRDQVPRVGVHPQVRPRVPSERDEKRDAARGDRYGMPGGPCHPVSEPPSETAVAIDHPGSPELPAGSPVRTDRAGLRRADPSSRYVCPRQSSSGRIIIDSPIGRVAG